MAKLYFLPRTALKDNASLLRLGWRIEGWAVGAVIGLLRLLPFEHAVACARRLFRARARFRERLTKDFPEFSPGGDA